jgi:hypothetical protein
MDVTKAVKTVRDHTYVPVKKAILGMKMEEPVTYHVVGHSQIPQELSILPAGLTVIQL